MKSVSNVLHGICASLMLLLFLPTMDFATPSGISGRTQKSSASGCGSCHGSSRTLTVNALFTGPDTVLAGQTAQFSMTISGGPAAGSGGDIAVRNGTLAAVSSFLKVSNGEIVQRNDVPMSGGSITYIFTYTAPATAGIDTLYGTALSTNSNGGTSGDQWNWAPKKPIVVTVSTPPPSVPVLLAPLNHSASEPLLTSLRWHASSGASTYRLQISTDHLFGTILLDDSTLTDTSRLSPSLDNGTTYYWRVRGKGAGGTGTYSTTWDFTTVVAPPPPPSLLLPADGATGVPPATTFSWSTSPTATLYRIQISTDSLFGSVALDDSTMTALTFQAPTLLPSTHYFWRVNAKNTVGNSPWSSTFGYTTMNGSFLTTDVLAHWNIISVPVSAGDSSVSTLFPAAISPATTFGNGVYVQSSVVSGGQGYWMKFPSAQVVSFFGTPRNTDSVHVVAGWNLIGTLSATIPVSSIIQIPSENVDSKYYGFDGHYIPEESLKEGKGYWVKVIQDGILILHTP